MQNLFLLFYHHPSVKLAPDYMQFVESRIVSGASFRDKLKENQYIPYSLLELNMVLRVLLIYFFIYNILYDFDVNFITINRVLIRHRLRVCTQVKLLPRLVCQRPTSSHIPHKLAQYLQFRKA